MYARVTVVDGASDQVDEGISSFKESVLPAVQSVDGYRGALLFVDRTSGKSMGMTLWKSEQARAQGAAAVEQAREATIRAMGSTVPPVDEYEVAVSDLR